MALCFAASWADAARGDGGALRSWSHQGGYEIAVFTEPTPPVVGPVDISVLLLDSTTGEPIPEADVAVRVTPEGRADLAIRLDATKSAATNKLFRAAAFELRQPGRLEVTVTVDGPTEAAQISFGLALADSSTPLSRLWFWILWPLPAIAIYVVHRELVARTDLIRSAGTTVVARPDG